MSQPIYAGAGAIAALGEVLDHHHASTVFLVRDHHSYALSGAAAAVTPALNGRHVVEFADFVANPNLDDVERGLCRFRETRPDIVVAVGGGSVMDMAKLIRIIGAHRGDSASFVRGTSTFENHGVPLVLAPTTAGSGSEATHFAVAYIGADKFSVADERLRADHIFLDHLLTTSMPASVTAACGLDALCQGIEAYWSVGSTSAVRGWARDAIGLARAHLGGAVAAATDDDREAMMRAAHLAGKAIDVAKTTAPHALSYALTGRYGLAHGHAVALTLGAVFAYNAAVTPADVTDPRGADHVRERIAALTELIGLGPADAMASNFASWLGELGLANRLRDVGVDRDDIADLASSVNAERLGNNPRRLTHAALCELLSSVY